MKFLIFYCFIIIGLLGAGSTTTKIANSKKNLSSTLSEKKKASRRLDKIAKDIKYTENDITKIEGKIAVLGQDKIESQALFDSLKVELDKSQNNFIKTSNDLIAKRKAFIKILSEQFSIVFAMEQAHAPTKKSIISQEIYKAYKAHNAKELESLKGEINLLNKRKKDQLTLRNKTQSKIAKIAKKRDALTRKKLAQKKLLQKLSVDEEKYNVKLVKIEDKQNSLRSTLATLNILHSKEVEDARKRAAARKEAMGIAKERKRRMRKAKILAENKSQKAKLAIKTAKTQKAKKVATLAALKADEEVARLKTKTHEESTKVRKVNSSYQKSKVYAYRGSKTISPIKGARLIKKFGTYIDPIYKIKIFNESITLKAPSSGAKVKNVLNGKVVFSGKSSMLGKVVVIAHSGKIHTVYAGLSKIAPNIKIGRKLKKGYVIGKVSNKLMFQATKDSKHINPLKLIHI
ncbi:MAG: peptidoglycan DD-metalloendopeptidase family protein [Campylobacterota bacterium]|nr:peptidoglycan DD-metalloendopeptidase family protein [Campylobacterota bacterium]